MSRGRRVVRYLDGEGAVRARRFFSTAVALPAVLLFLLYVHLLTPAFLYLVPQSWYRPALDLANELRGWPEAGRALQAELAAMPAGTVVQTGDRLGHPSCEGGTATGTHVHMARKYNGEWIPADGVLAFNLEGWIAHNGSEAYLGTLTRSNQVVRACTCSNQASFIAATRR